MAEQLYYPMSDKTGRDLLQGINRLDGHLKAIAEKQGARPKRYGFRVKAAEANPFDRVEYIYDAVGMTPAGLDSSDVFHYGSWDDVWFVRDNYPCMVKFDGTVDYRLNPLDHTKKEDGSESDVANAAYGGNAMSAIPLVWVKRYTEGGYRYFVACETQYDETYKAYAHTRPDGSISNYMFAPMFKGSLIDGKLRSIAGVKPQSSTTGTAELAYAKANGSRWGLRPWMADELVADLLTLMGKSTNCQLTFGQGHTTGASSAADFLDCGTMLASGQFGGKRSATNAQVKAFYMEGVWGERWDRTEGMLYIDGKYYVKPTPEGAGYNFTGAGFTEVGELSAFSGEGWVKELTATEYGSFPGAVGGSETTFDCDYYWQNKSGVRVPIRGGDASHGGRCGRYLGCDDAVGRARWYIGASPFLQNPS